MEDEDILDDEFSLEEEQNENEEEIQEEEQEDTPETSEAELRARERGWKSRDEWRGEVPDNFVDDPDEFNRRHEQSNPRLINEITELRSKVSEIETATKRALESQKRQHEADLKRERTRLMGEMRSATEMADTDRFDKAQKDLEVLEAARSAPESEEQKGNTYSPDTDPNFLSWYQENNWYKSDPVKTAAAEAIANQVVAARITPQSHGRGFYDEITRRLSESQGNNVSNTPRPNTGSPASGAGKPKTYGFQHLPQEFKKEFKYMVQRGIYENTEKERAAYTNQLKAEDPDIFKGTA